MTVKRIFNRFRPHVSGTVTGHSPGWDSLSYVDDATGSEHTHHIQAGLDIDRAVLTPGTRVRLQFGEMTRWTSAMNGGTQCFRIGGKVVTHERLVGHRCIAAIGHDNPRVTLMALRTMEHVFGAAATRAHLAHYAQGASTMQTAIEEIATGADISFRIEKGVLSCRAKIGSRPSFEVRYDGLYIACGDLPETVLAALGGQRADRLLDHPMLKDAETIVTEVSGGGDRRLVRTNRILLTMEEAFARLREPRSRAA